MARVSQIENIHFSQISVVEDAFGIVYGTSKTDQEGERSAWEKRHVYANPINAPLCVFTTLAKYLLVFPFSEGQSLLFPGKSQAKRFQAFFNSEMEER